MSPTSWPALRVDDWTDTRETLHMWLQIIGKVQMVSTPLINHWWNVTFEVSARGLRTRIARGPGQDFDTEFDFVDHQLIIRDTSGGQRSIKLEPKSVAQFFAEVQQAMGDLGIGCDIDPRPNEVSPAIPFAQDTEHHSYDAQAVNLWWRQLLAADRVFSLWRAGFAGKDSPVQVFWGSMDLSCTRYSGRTAPPHTSPGPPNCPPWVMAEAESRENAAAGFWPGGSAEGSFYAYSYPTPDGYAEAAVAPGYFDDQLGEWILPYDEVRRSADPDAALLAFLNTSYQAEATLAKWDRKLLDVNPFRLDNKILGS
ncbi:hypothetical protein GGQ54_001761 [Naumannella cuiyingiana]|uniref:Uncharacterized protein n=1 Tax=Naumannella cuiyingiana TaxID=1347891 RepID=A0A7Z0D921_9ACTN|nr:DUF5996 family protein [Naumannella cuiyingiana]NYI71201.1 hypothetical protein [Naumannella cuiyingiana]